MRKRQRRLRQFFWHERLSVATALAEFSHHTSRGQRMATAGGVEREVNYEPGLRNPLPRRQALCSSRVATTRWCLPPGCVQHFCLRCGRRGSCSDRRASATSLSRLSMSQRCTWERRWTTTDFLHGLPDHPEQLIVQEIPVSSSVDHAKQPRDVEQVLNGLVLHFHDEDVALGAFLEQVTIQEFLEVQVPSSGASLSTVGGFWNRWKMFPSQCLWS